MGGIGREDRQAVEQAIDRGKALVSAGPLLVEDAFPAVVEGPPAQAAGLPPRLIEEEGEPRAGVSGGDDEPRFSRELVIENDIAWRVHTLVDFMFPDEPRIVSKAGDTRRAQEIEAILGYVDEPELIHRDNLVLV